MCGILITHGASQSFHHGLLASLRRRGPDALGFWVGEGLHMAHTRLSIIGLEEASNQPIENEQHVLALNGEIYNFAVLKRRLQAEGVHFRTSSDTEVLLHAWTRWGAAVLPQLTGFWAFAIFDKTSQRLTLVRDQLGIKPLYYWRDGGRVCAASMLRTILEAAPVARDLDYQALSEYVRYQFTFGDRTFFQSIKKVLPGHMVEIDLRTGELEDHIYEDILNPVGELRPYSPELVEEIRALITRCCEESTVSDTSFTTLCSGGLDSSLITAITRPEVAYHCNYSDPDCNETFFARQVVADRPTRLLVVNAREEFDLIERLRELVEDFDELTIGSVILPLEDLLSQVKRRYKVVLTGTGGDELFAGYTRYQLALGECYQDSYRALYERMRVLRGVSQRFEMAHCKGNPALYRFYHGGAEAEFHRQFDLCRNQERGDLHAMLTFDRRFFLTGLLNIDDKLCGRHSIESRPSFLHQDLVRAVLRIEPGALLRDHELKYFLRRAAASHLPAAVLRRTDKMGFTTPVGTFVNQSAHFIREHIAASPFRDLYDFHRVHYTAENKFSREVFGLLILDLWLQRYAHPQTRAATA